VSSGSIWRSWLKHTETRPIATSSERIVFQSAGEPVQAVFTPPHGTRSPAAAVVVSPPRLRTIEQLDWLVQALSRAGYAVLAHRYRDAETRYQLRDVEDIRNAVCYLERRTEVDGKRIALVGHSRGGSASLRAAALDPRVRATVAFGAPSDIVSYVRALRDYAPSRHRLMVKAYGGTPDIDPEYYAAISPITYASRLRTPVLLVHGTNDLITPQEHSERMHQALVEAGNRSARLEVIDGMGHFFEHGSERFEFQRLAGLVLRWLQETL
jgi:dipeptidyl aminopeptidase/acylaminoacyl peptidase